MIRPWHRSRLFWLGVPGLLFLLWGWFAKPHSWADVRSGDYRVSIGNRQRQFSMFWKVTGPSGFEISGRQGTAHRNDTRLFPSAISHRVVDLSSSLGPWRQTSLSIAFWFLILLYLAVWGALLVAWQRRKARLLKTSASPPL